MNAPAARPLRIVKTETIEWIAVEHSLPDDEKTVLIYDAVGDSVWLGYYEDDGWIQVDGWPALNITHWAEVPKGPKDSAEDYARRKPLAWIAARKALVRARPL